ncbi:MAG: hypothetical protein Q8S33_18790 [Myxococcales bacterium]|nr:hypothetical protein [Myxococcales bacterium]
MSAIDALASRLMTLRHSDHPLGVDAAGAVALTQALRGGTDVGVALAQLREPGGVPRVLEVSKLADAVAVTDQLLTPLADAVARRRMLRASAAYPTVVLMTVVLAALVTQGLAMPAMRTFSADVSTTLDERLLPASFLFAVVMLVLLITSVALEAPFSPLRWVLRGVRRVLTLEAASVLCDNGVPMHTAFEAAAELAEDPVLRRATLEVSAALAAGRAPRGNALLEETAGRLVFAAASRGVGGPVTKALARHARSTATRALSAGSQGVQVVALLFAALALLAVAASWLLTYSAALTVGA